MASGSATPFFRYSLRGFGARVVVTEARSARDSSFVENVGTYHPRSKPAQVNLNKARIEHWLKQGAKPSDSVRTLLGKHLSRDLSAAPVVEAQ